MCDGKKSAGEKRIFDRTLVFVFEWFFFQCDNNLSEWYSARTAHAKKMLASNISNKTPLHFVEFPCHIYFFLQKEAKIFKSFHAAAADNGKYEKFERREWEESA